MQQRLMSVDAFRGLTIAGMILVNNPGSWSHIYAPLRHAKWHGWTPTDLVFPFFLFIVGVSLVLASARQRDQGVGRRLLTLRALRRGTVLFALGLFLASMRRLPVVEHVGVLIALAGASLLAVRFAGGAREGILLAAWLAYAVYAVQAPGIRIPGVLQRIGVCFFLASVAYLWLPRRALPWLVAGLLLGYWGLLELMPFPGRGAGSIDDEAQNLASYVDRALLDGHLWIQGVRDPEGPLHTLTALCTTLLGVFAAEVLTRGGPPEQRTLSLFLRGSGLALLGYLWSWAFPINKALWTSSYVLLTGGFATCALAGAHWFADVRGHRRATGPLVTYGLNAITVFVGSAAVHRLLDAIVVRERVTVPRWIYEQILGTGLPPQAASLAYALLWVTAWYGVLRVMQARGWIVRV